MKYKNKNTKTSQSPFERTLHYYLILFNLTTMDYINNYNKLYFKSLYLHLSIHIIYTNYVLFYNYY